MQILHILTNNLFNRHFYQIYSVLLSTFFQTHYSLILDILIDSGLIEGTK